MENLPKSCPILPTIDLEGIEPYDEEQPRYFPPELVNHCPNNSKTMYHCYLIELKPNFECDIQLHNIVLAVRTELESDVTNKGFDLEVSSGTLMVHMKYVGAINLLSEQVLLCRSFQLTVFRVLIDHNLNKLKEVIDALHLGNDLVVDYLLLPATSLDQKPLIIDWNTVNSVNFSYENGLENHTNCQFPKGVARRVQTKDGLLCSCILQNSLVNTPHNDYLYCIDGFLDKLDGNSPLKEKRGRFISYKEHYKSRYGITLCFPQESMVKGKHIFRVQNYLPKCRLKEKEQSNTPVELPPELCSVIMSPISICTFYSFSFVPPIMHRIESLLIAANLKRMHLDCMQNVDIPITKVLEAITMKECQEKFHLESMATLGDSFLKYAVSQQLFKTHQNHDQGDLTEQKKQIISNATLCKLGCDQKLPGFIRNEPFDPKKWIIPGDQSGSRIVDEELLSTTRKIYVRGRRKLRSKPGVADVVEALIGAYLSTDGEIAALLFMNWLGIKVDFDNIPYERHFQVHPEELVNISQLKHLLNYSFRDPTLLVEALTHGSYIHPGIPRCYQRLEFLGDSVVDFMITMHLYNKHPRMSPGLITDLRSASTNNDCYALSAVRAKLHEHILENSQQLMKRIIDTVEEFKKMTLESTFGWDLETSYPEVLADIVESLAGAILVDSGYNKERVFDSIRPLLEPLVTSETLKLQPVRELDELCKKQCYDLKVLVVPQKNGVTSFTVEVEANGTTHKYTSTAPNKETAEKVASREILKLLKNAFPGLQRPRKE